MTNDWSWPAVILVLGLGTLAFCLLMALLDAAVKWRNGGVTESQADDLRQLISRYEQLAEKTLDAQQRAAVDVAELRVRLASIEQILRTVE